MIYLGRRVTDNIKIFQDEALAIIHPLTGPACLDRNEYGAHKMILCTQLTSVYHCCILLRA